MNQAVRLPLHRIEESTAEPLAAILCKTAEPRKPDLRGRLHVGVNRGAISSLFLQNRHLFKRTTKRANKGLRLLDFLIIKAAAYFSCRSMSPFC